MAAELSCVSEYHVYQFRWTAVIWEGLTCRREPANAHDPFAVAVVKGSEIVGMFHCFIRVYVTYWWIFVLLHNWKSSIFQ